MYKADRRIYLDSNNNVVEADDPARATLLLAEGQTMPVAEARKYGLVVDDKAEDVRAVNAEPVEGNTPAGPVADEGTGTGPKKQSKRAAGPAEDK